jgi:hypothetical protein
MRQQLIRGMATQNASSPAGAPASDVPTLHSCETSARHRSRYARCCRCSCWSAIVLAPIIVGTAIMHAEELLRRFIVHTIQYKVGEGALQGAPISLDNVSVAFARSRWSLEARGLRIDNVPGEWAAPFAVQLDRLTLSLSGPLALLSLLQVPQANAAGAPGGLYRTGSLEFTVGFCIKAVEELELSGLTVYLEDAPPAEEPPPVLMRGPLLKKQRSRLGPPRLRYFELEPTLLRWFEPSRARPRRAQRRPMARGAEKVVEEVEAEEEELVVEEDEEAGEEAAEEKGAEAAADAAPAEAEGGEGGAREGRRRQKGAMRLFSSSSVEVYGELIELVSSKAISRHLPPSPAISSSSRARRTSKLSPAISFRCSTPPPRDLHLHLYFL